MSAKKQSKPNGHVLHFLKFFSRENQEKVLPTLNTLFLLSSVYTVFFMVMMLLKFHNIKLYLSFESTVGYFIILILYTSYKAIERWFHDNGAIQKRRGEFWLIIWAALFFYMLVINALIVDVDVATGIIKPIYTIPREIIYILIGVSLNFVISHLFKRITIARKK